MQRVRLWAPISISLAAVIVSILVLQKPTANPAEVQRLRAQLANMQSEQTRLEAAVIQLAKPSGSTGQGKVPSRPPVDAAPRGQTL